MIEYAWLHRMQTVRLFAYRFDAADFSPHGEASIPVAWVWQADGCARSVHPSRSVISWRCTLMLGSNSAWSIRCGHGGGR